MRRNLNDVNSQVPTPNSQGNTWGSSTIGNWKLRIGSLSASSAGLRVLLVVASSIALTACRQDMHDAPRYEPLEASAFFDNGGSARTLVANTVPRGYLREDEFLYTGRVSEQFANMFPMAVTADVMARGQERYDVFCAPCHGRTGVGNGMIVQRGFRQPPSYGEQRLREAPAGYYFDVMTNGFGAMQDYAAQVPVADRWAIVAYIRALQLSMNATVADVPADRRSDLDRPAQENQ